MSDHGYEGSVSIFSAENRAEVPIYPLDVFVLTDSGNGVNKNGYYTDKSTKITYQDMPILAKSGTFYILKAPLDVAEEISHLQASGSATFSLVLRPDQDTRQVDASKLGTTTNDVIIRYGLPLPVLYPPAEGPLPTAAPTPIATPPPSAAPSSSPGASPAVSPSPSAPRCATSARARA